VPLLASAKICLIHADHPLAKSAAYVALHAARCTLHAARCTLRSVLLMYSMCISCVHVRTELN
jgi:hypothetical protein